MPILLNQKPVEADLGPESTLGQALDLITRRIQAEGAVIIGIELDGASLQGAALADQETQPLGKRCLKVATVVQAELARTTIGKLAALVEFLGRRQHDIAALIEQGQSPKALGQLGDLLAAWQQVQQAYAGLTRLLGINLKKQLVGERTADERMREFHGQLEEIQTALQNKDMVLLGDVLQYEFDAAIQNWNSLLATTLGIVDGVVELAG